MALTRPILNSTVAFDASQEHIFTFNVIGGDQVVRSQLTIIRQSDGVAVYESSQESFAYNYILPANSLTNGVYYSAYIQTYNYNNDVSPASNNIVFYCYSTPLFEFQNIPLSGIITNQSFNFEVLYNQNEYEALSSYIFNLYNTQGTLVATSGTLYTSSEAVPLTVFYNFAGFANNTSYYIQATGVTSQGTQISTNMVSFYVQYSKPPIYSIVELNNNCEGGYITIKSNLVEIDGTSNPDPPIYTEDNTAIDLSENGSYLLWDKGYIIDGDFTASLWGNNFNSNTTIITMESEDTILTVNYKDYNENLKFAELIVKEGDIIYYIYSNPVFVFENDNLQVWLRRVGSLYEIQLYDLAERPPLILNSYTQGYLDVNKLS